MFFVQANEFPEVLVCIADFDLDDSSAKRSVGELIRGTYFVHFALPSRALSNIPVSKFAMVGLDTVGGQSWEGRDHVARREFDCKR